MSNPDHWYRLADMPVTEVGYSEPSAFATGRRMRAFQRLASPTFHRYQRDVPIPTVAAISNSARECGQYAELALYLPTAGGDPTLHIGLQDLGDDINVDVHDACEAAFHSLPYAGVDDGIEPVTDDHVRLVIPALQRELDRELRSGPGGGHHLPAYPLKTLPWAIQRALAERRRLRYQQFGLTREVWKRATWSLWDVPLDDDYIPLRAAYEHAGTVTPSNPLNDFYDYYAV